MVLLRMGRRAQRRISHGVSWTTQSIGVGLRNEVKQSRQPQIVLARAVLVTAFLDG
jgi:hypothetical protein